MKGKLQNNIQSTLVDPSDPDVYSVICCMINFIFDWIKLLLLLLSGYFGKIWGIGNNLNYWGQLVQKFW